MTKIENCGMWSVAKKEELNNNIVLWVVMEFDALYSSCLLLFKS